MSVVCAGYNVQDFDIPYLLNRAKTLKILDQFSLWGRLQNDRARKQPTNTQPTPSPLLALFLTHPRSLLPNHAEACSDVAKLPFPF